MHAVAVPCLSTGCLDDGKIGCFLFVVIGGGQTNHFKGPNLIAVRRRIILRVADNVVSKDYDSAARSRDMRLAAYDGTLRMFHPWSQQVLGIKETESVIIWGLCDEQPQSRGKLHKRCIDIRAFQKGFDK